MYESEYKELCGNRREPRGKLNTFARKPTFPKEIVSLILTHVPASNRLEWWTDARVEVDGLLPLVLWNPSALLPHFKEPFDPKWTLDDIAHEWIKNTLLEEASLTKCIKLCVVADFGLKGHSGLHEFATFPLQWKILQLIGCSFLPLDDFIESFKYSLPYLKPQELEILSWSSWSYDPPVNMPSDSGCMCTTLKKVGLSFNVFYCVFNSGILDSNSIIDLTLECVEAGQIESIPPMFREILHELPHILSQLPHLKRLRVTGLDCNKYDLKDYPRVKSTSLHSLTVEGGFYEPDGFPGSFLSLFSDCPIDCLTLRARFLREANEFAWNIRRLHISVWSFITMHFYLP